MAEIDKNIKMSKWEFTFQENESRKWSAGICRKRKQLELQKILRVKEPQAARWLLAVLLFFDGIPIIPYRILKNYGGFCRTKVVYLHKARAFGQIM